MTMKTTDWKNIGRKERIRATYGLQKFEGQAPYISVTGEIEEKRGGKWRESSGGMLHDDISKHFPELRELIKWHLVAAPGVPMHYLANGQYWWEKIIGTSKWKRQAGEPDPTKAFKNTILYGQVAGDDDLVFKKGKRPTLKGKSAPDDIRPWLEKRSKQLERDFAEVVKQYDLKSRAANPDTSAAKRRAMRG